MAVAMRPTITVTVPLDGADLLAKDPIIVVTIPGIYNRANASHTDHHIRAREDKERRTKAGLLAAAQRRQAGLPEVTADQRRLVKGTIFVQGEWDDDNAIAALKCDVDGLVDAKILWRDRRRWCRQPYTPDQVIVAYASQARVELAVYDLGLATPERVRRSKDGAVR